MMSVIYIVLPLAVILAAAALGAFLWSVRRGQFDDLDGPPIRAVFDDEDDTLEAGRAGRDADASGE